MSAGAEAAALDAVFCLLEIALTVPNTDEEAAQCGSTAASNGGRPEMCGKYILGGVTFEEPCLIDPYWWLRNHPNWTIDFTNVVLNRPMEGPAPEPWRAELTAISQILRIAGNFSDGSLANHLAGAAVEVGNKIAERENFDVQFGWSAHDESEAKAG